MSISRKRLCAWVLASLAAPAADAANIQANVVVPPPANGTAYQVGEQVTAVVRLRGETVPVENLELVQIDLKVTGAATILDSDLDGVQDVEFAPFGPDGLAGVPAGVTTFSVISPSGGIIYAWIRTTTIPEHLFDLPAADPGRAFVTFPLIFTTLGQATISAIGPCLNDSSSSGAHANEVTPPVVPLQQYASCDSDLANNWVQGVPGGGMPGGANMNFPGLTLMVVPEPVGSILLVVAVIVSARRRAT